MNHSVKITLFCALAGLLLFAASCSKKEDEEYLFNPKQVSAPMEGMSQKNRRDFQRQLETEHSRFLDKSKSRIRDRLGGSDAGNIRKQGQGQA